MTESDLDDYWSLSRGAFGWAPHMRPSIVRMLPETHRWGAFDTRGRLVGSTVDHEERSWWGGRAVASANLTGVAVSPEVRGGGVARGLLTAVLTAARERGAAVSALYPTVSAAYRSLGWEVTGVLGSAVLDTAALPTMPGRDVLVRPGSDADRGHLRDLYERIVRGYDGPLTRRGGRWEAAPPADHPVTADVELVSVVEEGDLVTGAVSYSRSGGYGPEGVLNVREVLADSAAAARALVGVLAGWRSVTRMVRLPLLAGDAVAGMLPLERATSREASVFMHRLVDLEAAMAGRGWPPHVRGAIEVRVVDEYAPWNTGTWRLELDSGEGRATRTRSDPDLVLGPRGLALLWTAAGGGRVAAGAGLVTGAGDPAALDLLACGRPPHMLDLF